MLRKIARLLDRLSPAFGQFARQTYLAFRHRQLHGLIRSAINWQTNYLEKKQLESSCLSFATQESIARLKSEEPKGKPSIAVIAPMPPASTGIAWYTLSSFLAASYCVDIYAHYESIDDYLNAVQDARLTGSNVRIFSTDALPTGRMTNAYKAQVFIVGNSDHNVRVGRALWRLAEFPTNLPTYVYIHDPCLLNIVAILCREFNISFEGLLRKQYGAKLDASPRSMGFNHRELIERHVYGPKALLNEVKVDGIIVNSTAAADLVQKDFPELDRRKIHKLFNPVCRPSPAPEAHASDGRTRIGTFGIPSAAGKRTDIVVDAFRKLQCDRPNVELLIAGYGAHEFGRAVRLSSKEPIIIEDSPSTSRLQALMRSCDIAVQLRKDNLGESSGVVPQLLALGKPTIVSAVGAFLEFGDAVACVPADATSDQIATVICHELDRRTAREAAIEAYVATHNPAQFCRQLMRLIEADNLPSRGDLPDARAREDIPDIRDLFVARVASGKSFIDVGGLYGIIRERVSVARKHGATTVALLDIEPLGCLWWAQMRDRLRDHNISDCVFISGAIETTEIDQFDVVYSSGLLYHALDPVAYLRALHRVAREYVIIASTVLPKKIGYERPLTFAPGSVLYLPAVQLPDREIIERFFAETCGRPNLFGGGCLPEHSNWWLPTAEAMIAMCEDVGFEVADHGPIELDPIAGYAALLRRIELKSACRKASSKDPEAPGKC